MSSEQIVTGSPYEIGKGEDPLYYYTRIYLSFLQKLFSYFKTGELKWSFDEKLTEITITDQIPLPRDVIAKRPAIVTMRGPAQFGNLSLDNMQLTDSHTGIRRHTDIVACTMGINCMAKNGVEAQRIAWTVMSNIRRFKRLLQKNGFHKVGDEVSIGPESSPGSLIAGSAETEATLVTVQSPFYFQWTEVIEPQDSPVLSEIDGHLTAQLGQGLTTQMRISDPRYTTLKAPTLRGVKVGDSVPIDTKNTIKQKL